MKTLLNIHKTLLFAAFLLFSALSNAQTVSYLWSNGATTPSIDVNPTETTTYYVTITQNGVEYIDSLVVSIDQPAAASINGENSIFFGSSTILQASEGASYAWSTGETTSAIAVSPEINTTYSVDVFDTNGCVSSATQNITISPNPSVSFLPNNTTYCNNSGSVELSGGSPVGGIYSGPGVSNGEFNPAAAGGGLHPITYTYTNANGCAGSETVEYEVAVCTGVEKFAQPVLEVRPNPMESSTWVSLKNYRGQDAQFNLLLMDATGRKVFEKQIAAEVIREGYQLHIPELASGTYVLMLNNANYSGVKRLVK